MNHLIGQSWGVFLVITALTGFLSYLASKSCALGWKSLLRAFLYGGLIVFVNRFLLYALRGAHFLDPVAFIVTTVFVGIIIVSVYRFFKTHLITQQYPWLYEKTGSFTCQHKVTETFL